jgi:hypothetical protein
MTRLRWSTFVLAALLATHARAAVPTPTITGPITSPGGAFVTPPSGLDLSQFGWVEQEFFVSGTARAYRSALPLGADGNWTATPDGATAPYKTRVLVRRPTSPRKFNGTVIVEWLNVSGGLDAAPDWTFIQTLVRRDGYAWVGVSAQFQGVQGTGGPIGLNLSLKSVNPARYGSLSHPGDSFSYDIFTQVASALRQPNGPAPLGPLHPRRLIAVGESQSAFRLTTYVNAIQPIANAYDAVLIHSRGGGSAQLSQSPQTVVDTPAVVHVREDIDVPVLMLQTETDLVTLGYHPARQPDTGKIRTWEIAGTAHDDAYGLAFGPADAGRAALDTTYTAPVTSIFGVINCSSPINQGPQHYVVSAAVRKLHRWARTNKVRGGHAPRLEVAAGTPPVIQRDQLGNALGGIRTAQVDVPIATLSGLGQTGGSFCALFGTTVPFDDATLASLYPSHDEYVRRVLRATRAAVRDGFILPADVEAIRQGAMASDIPPPASPSGAFLE